MGAWSCFTRLSAHWFGNFHLVSFVEVYLLRPPESQSMFVLICTSLFLPTVDTSLMGPQFIVLAEMCCLIGNTRGKVQLPGGYSKHQSPPAPAKDTPFNISLSFNLVQGTYFFKTFFEIFLFSSRDQRGGRNHNRQVVHQKKMVR